MKRIYLDTNVLHRLAADRPVLEALLAAQRARRTRCVLGYRLMLELAGAVGPDRRLPEGLMARVQVALQLMESGADVANDGLRLSQYCARLSPMKRWRQSAVFARDSDDYRGAVETLALIGDEANRLSTHGWYVRNMGDRKGFQERLEGLRDKLRSGLRPRDHLTAAGGMARELDRLADVGWLQQRAAHYAAQSGYRRRIPEGVRLDWFGPLGRLVRAEMALLILRSRSRPGQPAPPATIGDMGDALHVVVAGIVRCFVTDDEEAKQVFDATWPERRRTCMLYRQDFANFVRAIEQ